MKSLNQKNMPHGAEGSIPPDSGRLQGASRAELHRTAKAARSTSVHVKCPRLLVAATQSGAGKTSIALGLVAAYRRRGLRVQTFKVGPDFLDPTYLALASGRPCYNLDGWMSDREYLQELFVRATTDADLAIIEGVMGLFDGAGPDSSRGSSAEIARLLSAPVLLVVCGHGLSSTIAPLVRGFVGFESGVEIAGVVANHCGSQGHVDWLSEALRAADGPPLLGALTRESLPKLSNRHLGLVTADPERLRQNDLDRLAYLLAESIDLESLLQRAGSVPILAARQTPPAPLSAVAKIGVAHDAAFHFYYPDNLEMLARAGGRLHYFSPLIDEDLPPDLDAIYLGGGYPEEHAEDLANNQPMRDALRRFATSGRPVYAECGGLVYLSRQIETLDGRTHPMTGVLPAASRMCSTRRRLGYAEITTRRPTPWGATGTAIRGHEFHYSELVEDPLGKPGWQAAYTLTDKRSGQARPEGFQNRSVLASYVHLHWASLTAAARHFVRHCLAVRNTRKQHYARIQDQP